MNKQPTEAELIGAIRTLKVICAGAVASCVLMLYGIWRLISSNSFVEFWLYFLIAIALERICWWERRKLKWIIDAITEKGTA